MHAESPKHIFRMRVAGRVESFAIAGSGDDGGVTDVDFDTDEPNVVTSKYKHSAHTNTGKTTYHLPVIDLDLDARLEPSSTPGHHHLYIDKAMTQEDYFKLLKVMAEVGLVEEGYYQASLKRGYSTARLPWVAKDEEIFDWTPEELPRHIKRLLG